MKLSRIIITGSKVRSGFFFPCFPQIIIFMLRDSLNDQIWPIFHFSRYSEHKWSVLFIQELTDQANSLQCGSCYWVENLKVIWCFFCLFVFFKAGTLTCEFWLITCIFFNAYFLKKAINHLFFFTYKGGFICVFLVRP